MSDLIDSLLTEYAGLNFLELVGAIAIVVLIVLCIGGLITHIKWRMSIRAHYKELYKKHPEKDPKNKG